MDVAVLRGMQSRKKQRGGAGLHQHKHNEGTPPPGTKHKEGASMHRAPHRVHRVLRCVLWSDASFTNVLHKCFGQGCGGLTG